MKRNSKEKIKQLEDQSKRPTIPIIGVPEKEMEERKF